MNTKTLVFLALGAAVLYGVWKYNPGNIMKR